MSEQLTGRRVVVTGAASGIGAAIAATLAAQGAIVTGLDRNLCEGLAFSVLADLRVAESVDRALADIAGNMGMPEIVVHAAAMQLGGGCVDTDPAMFAAIYEVNVIAAVRLMRWCVPSMRVRGGGALLFISSINASFATPSLAAYAASKAALENLVKTAALEFAPDAIRVNAIAPASIDTPTFRTSYAGQPDNALATNAKRHPLARLGTADEVAALALFLLSERAGWITGAIYPIDGGASVTRR